MSEKKRWVVSVPVLVMVSVEVRAPTKHAAIVAANEAVAGLEAFYDGGGQMDRPPYIGISSDLETGKAWFDTNCLDYCDMFLSDKVDVEPFTSTGD